MSEERSRGRVEKKGQFEQEGWEGRRSEKPLSGGETFEGR